MGALIIGLVGLVALHVKGGAPELAGGIFTDSPPAANFSLVDQNGEQVTMDATRGKVVALTFLYTRCPDVCPTIASGLAVANTRLGGAANSLEMLAVSVDPVNDTLPAIKKFTEAHNLADAPNWHYLIGSPSQLRNVWQAYHIDSSAEAGNTADGVDHSALVYMVDPKGKLRVVLPANFTVSDFVNDVRALEHE